MSRERARRRAAREAEAAKRQEEARRRAARAARWRALRRRLLPRRRHSGHAGRLAGRFSSPRGRAQLAAITAMVAVPLAVAWYFVDAWPQRIGAVVLALLALPAIVTLTLDRSTR